MKSDRKQLDDIIMAEVNVKELSRVIVVTEKGRLDLVYDGKGYFLTLNKEVFHAPNLLAHLIKQIECLSETKK